MQTEKTIQAINGDTVTVGHPGVDLSASATSHVTVAYGGRSHLVTSAATDEAFNYANTSAEFAVNGHLTRIVERMDNVAFGAVHTYQAILTTDSGVISTQSYESREGAVELLGALRPEATPLGVRLHPSDEARIISAPRVVLYATGLGMLEIAPLTDEIIQQMPDWQGTPIDDGELFAAAIRSDVPYLIHASSSARTHLMIQDGLDIDELTNNATKLKVTWQR